MSAVFRLLLAAAFLVPAAALGLPTVRSPAQFAPRSNVRMTEDTPKSSPLPRSTSSPMVNIEQKKLAWPYFAAVIAAGCLATGGIFEDQVAELFEPVSSKGGWAGALGINPPGVDAVRAAKKVKGYTLRTVDAQQQPGSLIFPADATALA